MGSSKDVRREEKLVEVSSYVKPFESWVGKSLMVRTSDLPTLVKLDKLLESCDGPKVDIKYVGGLYLLLCFKSSEEMKSFIDFNPNVKVWFSWLEIWNGQALPFERKVF
ncbi:hypothetical protein HanIR_Chr01g0027451 [Helianthus annuus]|nr:hypothetical protein HanIR_Chr01g0027451 [Helianthus annuus]